ncbi:hypothetical protein ACTI_55670 [Actinoplanes sp. OR16]|uniref:hypothetical protein n=1 Tax=Actinoplanes sp. OR16 TaxID=946334 RepID=UPI000F6E01D5|nr:hypothetical protein [Actinoplanes sp. OR16]BBH68882.1 hypothetical protein ACTI_55670 [Actinoplanes sp. OR16]
MIKEAALAALMVLTGTPAHAEPKYGPYQVDEYAVPAVKSGVGTWVKTWWSSLSDVCDVRVTVKAPDVTITYPENTGTYTSFRRTADLARDDNDYTAFRVVTTTTTTRWIELATEVEYTKLPENTLKPGSTASVPCTGKRSHRETTTRLLVLE